MKFIFDFDDMLFNTKQLKDRIFLCLDKVGVSYDKAEAYYKKVRGGEFSLKNFITELFNQEKIKEIRMENVYEDIMSECLNFVNKELVDVVHELGKENCYLATYGEKEFQLDKIKRAGIFSLFSEIIVVPGSKKEIIYDICEKNKAEKILFIDNKIEFFEDLDMAKCPNLKTILYDEQGLEKLREVMEI